MLKGREFDTIKDELLKYVKAYYPTMSNSFTENSPGMLFIDLASYLGDSLNFYLDKNVNELFLDNVEDINNAIHIAQNYGYRPKCVYPSSTELDMFVAIPAMINGSTILPDTKYLPKISAGTICKTNNGITFYIDDEIIFTEDLESTYDEDYNLYIYKKSNIPCYNAEIKEKKITVPSDPVEFYNITLPENNIIKILNIVDSEGNKWYESPFLAHDLHIIDDNGLVKWKNDNGYRYNIKITDDFKTVIQFGDNLDPDIPSLNIPEGLKIFNYLQKSSYNYGRIPYNTSLTITYLTSIGENGNVEQDSINIIDEIIANVITMNGQDSNVFNNVKQSIIVNNPTPAIGGDTHDSINEIKNKTKLMMFSQMRLSSIGDYLSRIYEFPSKYGKIFKAHVSKGNDQNDVNIYVITKGIDNTLTNCNTTLKNNLKKYLDYYKLSQNINIFDLKIINIKVVFDISIVNGYNPYLVLTKCIEAIKSKLDATNFEPEQPIYKSEITSLVESIDGVKVLRKLDIINSQLPSGVPNASYSKYYLNGIESMSNSGIIYPGENSIFEIKYDNDIEGRII